MPYGYPYPKPDASLWAFQCEQCGETSIIDVDVYLDHQPMPADCGPFCTYCGARQPRKFHYLASGDAHFQPPLHSPDKLPAGTSDWEEIKAAIDASHGKPVRLWAYFVSHCELDLRIRQQDSRNMLIYCSDVEEIMLPTRRWNSALSLKRQSASEGGKILLQDEDVGVRIVCGMIRLYFDVEPGL